VSRPSLKYAHVERERRFLLDALPDGAEDVLRIRDRYLHDTRLRLREVESPDGTVVRKLGHKVRLSDGPGEIACTSLYLDDAEWDALGSLPGDELVKTRHCFRDGDRLIAVDAFADLPLVLAEIDAGDGPHPEPPEWLRAGADVTLDEQFTGAALARARPEEVARAVQAYQDVSNPSTPWAHGR
jgi:CYTH domain-containing protein